MKPELAPHQLINQTSGEQEWYTPFPIVEAARQTMGWIDLDPASSSTANQRVKAVRYFHRAQNGLLQPWSGTVWLNHPFGRRENRLWIDKLVTEWGRGEVDELCCITYAATSEGWFQPLLELGSAQCWLRPRTRYVRPDGTAAKAVPKGSVVTYFGPFVHGFRHEFRRLGLVTRRV